MRNPSGLLLVGHGTRDLRGIAEFLSLAGSVGQLLPQIFVEPCFLELAEPTIAQAVANLAQRGVKELTVMPVLLFAAGHARRDIPRAVAAACDRYPGLTAVQKSHFGCHPLVLELSAQRFREALQDKVSIPNSATLLLLVGRGSLDASATDEMHRFAQWRAGMTPVGRVETCFIAMAQPNVSEALEGVSRLPYGRIVIQPHLLFEGELLQNLQQQVADRARNQPAHEWLVTRHLGNSPKLAEAIVDIAMSAGASTEMRTS